MPVKSNFASGEVLTANDVNGFLTNGGLVYAGAVSGTSNRLNLSQCFDSKYAAYRVVVTNLTHTTANNLIVRLSASGTDTAGSAYFTQRSEVTGGAVTGVSIPTGSALFPTFVNSTAGSFATITFDVINPQVATTTTFIGGASRIDGATGLYMVTFSGLLNDNGVYDGISLVGNTGTISATMRVYGYRQA
jgi:hypothetical protein